MKVSRSDVLALRLQAIEQSIVKLRLHDHLGSDASGLLKLKVYSHADDGAKSFVTRSDDRVSSTRSGP